MFPFFIWNLKVDLKFCIFFRDNLQSNLLCFFFFLASQCFCKMSSRTDSFIWQHNILSSLVPIYSHLYQYCGDVFSNTEHLEFRELRHVRLFKRNSRFMVVHQYVNNYTIVNEGEEWVFEIILDMKIERIFYFIFIICVDVCEFLCVCVYVHMCVQGSLGASRRPQIPFPQIKVINSYEPHIVGPGIWI